MTVGVVLLDTAFARPPGDIGNAASFLGPVLYETVPAATVARIVRAGGPDPALLEPFAAAARRLVARGAAGIATSCGFLAAWQKALAAAVAVPVVSSALCLVPGLQAAGRRVAVLGYDAGTLGAAHFAGCGVRDLPTVGGLDPAGPLFRCIAQNSPDLDLNAAETGVVADAKRLAARCPGLSALVFECTNLPPYRRAVSAALDVAVYDIFDALEMALGRPVRAVAAR